MKRFLKGLERELWRGVIEECGEVSARSRIGDMHKCLRRLGTRERPAARNLELTVDEYYLRVILRVFRKTGMRRDQK